MKGSRNWALGKGVNLSFSLKGLIDWQVEAWESCWFGVRESRVQVLTLLRPCSVTLEGLFKFSLPQESENSINSANIGNILGGLVPGLPANTKICGCSSLLYKLAQYLHISYLHITYTYLLIYFKSSEAYLWYLTQCKCYVNSCQGRANSSSLAWNFLKFSEYFWSVVESTDAEPADTEGQLCLCHGLLEDKWGNMCKCTSIVNTQEIWALKAESSCA